MKKSRFSQSGKAIFQVFLLLVVVSLNLGPAGTAYAAQPANDDWSLTLEEPFAITDTDLPFTHTQGIDEATTQFGEPKVNQLCDGKLLETGDNTVWYTYTPSASKTVSFDTVGSIYESSPGVYEELDTYIAIWKGDSFDALTFVGCDDDNDIGFTSQFALPAQAGTTYYIQVAEYNGYQGAPDNSECNISPDIYDITGCSVTLHVKYQTFTDVPPTHPYFEYIEVLYANGYTNGCNTSPLMYCPSSIMNRAQIAKFFMTVQFGGSYVPPSNTPLVFQDKWNLNPWAEIWANDMKAKGLTSGCNVTPALYCPDVQVPRDQVAKFGLTMKYGNAYSPPPATGTVFADLTNVSYWATAWAEQAYAEGIVTPCGTDTVSGKPKFCPSDPVDRGFAAFVIVTAKGLLGP